MELTTQERIEQLRLERVQAAEQARLAEHAAKAEEARVAALNKKPRGRPKSEKTLAEIAERERHQEALNKIEREVTAEAQRVEELLSSIPSLRDQAEVEFPGLDNPSTPGFSNLMSWFGYADRILREFHLYPPTDVVHAAHTAAAPTLVDEDDDQPQQQEKPRATADLDVLALNFVLKAKKFKLNDTLNKFVFQVLQYAFKHADKFTNRAEFIGQAEIVPYFQRLEKKYGS